MRFAKYFAPQHLLCLLLGTALGACSSSGTSSQEETRHGIRTVSFDSNGGDTEAVPSSMALLPPATTLGSLPTPPTRAGYAFVEWNTERDGSGSPFTEDTPVLTNILLIVYARWQPIPTTSLLLGLSLPPEAAAMTALKTNQHNERLASFTLRVSGFNTPGDADNAKFELKLPNGLSLREMTDMDSTDDTKAWGFVVEYDGMTAFPEGFAPVGLKPAGLPAGYAYDAGQQARLPLVDGLVRTRPIPVYEDNIRAFNDYANTPEGLERHYRLVEHVALKPPEEGKSNWTAIGTFVSSTNQRPFTGSFDGGGHTLSGLTVLLPGRDTQGMFGFLGQSALVKNLGLENVNVQGRGRVGGLAGYSYGTVHDCYVTGTVDGEHNFVGGLLGINYEGTVHSSHSTSKVQGRLLDSNSSSVGGLLGANYANGTVYNCYATGEVIGSSSVGGLVGENISFFDGVSTVKNSYATGQVRSGNMYSGGLVGGNKGLVRNCYATGNIEGRFDVGGLVGLNVGRGEVQSSYATGSVDASGHTPVGGLVGSSVDSGAVGAVHNSVALGPSVRTAGGQAVGRITGKEGGGPLSGNYARGDMVLSFAGGEPTGAHTKDGESTSEYNTQAFWTQTLSGWDFSETGDWAWEEGFLPTLRGPGGKQEPKAQGP